MAMVVVGEKVTLEQGSRQDDLWGGGVDLKSRKVETMRGSVYEGRLAGTLNGFAEDFLLALRRERSFAKKIFEERYRFIW